MKSSLFVSVALLVVALPFAAVVPTADAQTAVAQTAPPPSGDLKMERKEKKAVVLPKPSQEQVRADAERAVDEVTGKTPGQVVRETSPVRPSSRPDLDYDVRSGIQGRNLNRELFKR